MHVLHQSQTIQQPPRAQPSGAVVEADEATACVQKLIYQQITQARKVCSALDQALQCTVNCLIAEPEKCGIMAISIRTSASKGPTLCICYTQLLCMSRLRSQPGLEIPATLSRLLLSTHFCIGSHFCQLSRAGLQGLASAPVPIVQYTVDSHCWQFS